MIWLSVAVALVGTIVLAGRAHSRRLDGMEDRRNAIGALLREYHAREAAGQVYDDFSTYFVDSNVPHLTGIPSITSNDVRSLPHNWSPAPHFAHDRDA